MGILVIVSDVHGLSLSRRPHSTTAHIFSHPSLFRCNKLISCKLFEIVHVNNDNNYLRWTSTSLVESMRRLEANANEKYLLHF